MGSLHLGMDALSALFVFVIAVVCGLCAVYGAGYLDARRHPRRTAPRGRSSTCSRLHARRRYGAQRGCSSWWPGR